MFSSEHLIRLKFVNILDIIGTDPFVNVRNSTGFFLLVQKVKRTAFATIPLFVCGAKTAFWDVLLIDVKSVVNNQYL